MVCPKCKQSESQVVDSRDVHGGIRRRRECLNCKFRYTTYERIETPTIVVIKKDGSRERFTGEKIRKGVCIACKNRPVSSAQIDDLVSSVEHQVSMTGKDEITSEEIGGYVRDHLKQLDEVAYVRFVSVYKAFSDIKEFTKTINTLT